MQSQQGYDRAITVFSPDGRLFQVEYAIETVRRGALAVGVKTKDGVIIAVDEKTKKLQITHTPQKLFQIDYHVGAAAAGYIPDARVQIDNARFFSQSNKLVYDEPVEIETVAKHLADQCQQYTQYGGARPIGVSLIIGGVDSNGSTLYLTDPSGAYILYNAIVQQRSFCHKIVFATKWHNFCWQQATRFYLQPSYTLFLGNIKWKCLSVAQHTTLGASTFGLRPLNVLGSTVTAPCGTCQPGRGFVWPDYRSSLGRRDPEAYQPENGRRSRLQKPAPECPYPGPVRY